MAEEVAAGGPGVTSMAVWEASAEAVAAVPVGLDVGPMAARAVAEEEAAGINRDRAVVAGQQAVALMDALSVVAERDMVD